MDGSSLCFRVCVRKARRRPSIRPRMAGRRVGGVQGGDCAGYVASPAARRPQILLTIGGPRLPEGHLFKSRTCQRKTPVSEFAAASSTCCRHAWRRGQVRSSGRSGLLWMRHGNWIRHQQYRRHWLRWASDVVGGNGEDAAERSSGRHRSFLSFVQDEHCTTRETSALTREINTTSISPTWNRRATISCTRG